MFVGAYWSNRKESKKSAAQRIVAFLAAAEACSDDLVAWYCKGQSPAEALRSPLLRESTSIARMLVQNRRDTDHETISDLGYRFVAWNGAEVSFSATIGCWNRNVRNAVVLNLGIAEHPDNVYQKLLEAMTRVFDPDHAVVTSNDHLRAAGATLPWEAGLLTYERGGAVQIHARP